MGFTQENQYLTISTPLGKDKLLMAGFHGEERMSEPFHFSLEMVSEHNSLGFSSIVGQNATVTVNPVDGPQYHFNGIVGRFAQVGRDAVYHFGTANERQRAAIYYERTSDQALVHQV